MLKPVPIITTAAEEDLPTVQRIAYDTWPIAYTGVISAEQIAYMLEMMYSLPSLERQMKEEGCEFLLVQFGRDMAGFAAYSEEEPGKFKLHKLYVLPQMQHLKLGRTLLYEVCMRAKARGGKLLMLQVNKNNKAQSFYERNGFNVARAITVDIGHGYVMDDYVMEKAL
ncbi:MAG: GNAT family N-acetyltransferase [Flavobacteriales bacterium]